MHPLVKDIRDGNFDEILDELAAAVKARQSGAKLATAGLALGDRCRFVDNVRPIYLNTFGVEIVDVKDSGEVIVKALAPRARGRRFRVWTRQLEKVAA
jgi:hypothetical protein